MGVRCGVFLRRPPTSKPTATIIIQLDPAKLDNPDLDIRYVLPDLLVSRAGGLLSDGGYDYAEDPPGAMLLFLETDHPCRSSSRR